MFIAEIFLSWSIVKVRTRCYLLSLLLSVDCRKIVVKLWKWLGNEISIVEYFGIIRGENLIAGKIGRKIFDVHRTPISMLIHRYATSYATPLHDSVVAILLLWLYKYLLWLSAQINNTQILNVELRWKDD